MDHFAKSAHDDSNLENARSDMLLGEKENEFADLSAACEEVSRLLNGLMKALNK